MNPEAGQEATGSRRAAAKQAYLRRQPLYHRAERLGMASLVVVGVAGLILVLPLMLRITGWQILGAIGSIDWSDLGRFYASASYWIDRADSSFAIVWIFCLAYCVLLWHWLAELRGWRRILAGKGLWGASFAFSCLVVVGIFCLAAIDDFYAEMVGIMIVPAIIIMGISCILWHLRTLRDDHTGDSSRPD